MHIDAKDAQILTLLRSNARSTRAEIGRSVGLTPTAVLERIRNLEEAGVITGYEARIDPEAIGLGLLAYVLVEDSEPGMRVKTGALLAGLPGVLDVCKIAGRASFLVKVRVEDNAALAALLETGFGEVGTVRSTETMIVLETVVEDRELVIEPGDQR